MATKYDEQFFAINDTDLHGEIIRLAPAYSRVIFELAKVKIAKLTAEAALKRCRGEIEAELRSELQGTGQKVTEGGVTALLESMPQIDSLSRALLQAEQDLVMAQAVVDAFSKKKDLVVSLAGLARAEIETIRGTR